MNQSDVEVLARFEEVWQRVQQGREVREEEKNCDLRPLMDGLQYCRQGYFQLAACTCGTEKKRLQVLHEQTDQLLRKVQLQYFLKEGDSYFSKIEPNFASYTPYNLRKLWQTTVENAELMKNCNLKGDAVFVAEFERIKEKLVCQKNDIEWLIGRLLQ